jgi:hypothetical protein
VDGDLARAIGRGLSYRGSDSNWTKNNAKPVWNQAVSAGELPVQDIAESVCFALNTQAADIETTSTAPTLSPTGC